MKRLISEEEICDCRNTNSIFNLNKYIQVEVAEEKIKSFAIEFNCWCWSNHISPCGDGTYYDGLSNKRYNSDLFVFEKFLSTRE